MVVKRFLYMVHLNELAFYKWKKNHCYAESFLVVAFVYLKILAII